MKNIPYNWEKAKLIDFCDVVMGQSPPSNTYNTNKEGLPFYQGKKDFGNIYPNPTVWCSNPKKIALKNDILISVRAPVGPTNLAPDLSCIGRGLSALHPLDKVHNKYVLYLMRWKEKDLARLGTGSTFSAISGKILKNYMLPLAPLNEQHRIVNKIESLFSKIDAGVASLSIAKERLTSYRQSLLKAAIEGRLTETWREKHRDELEPASAILERIRTEREKQQKGKKHKELPPLDTSQLPELPEGWEWVKFISITENHDKKRVPISQKKRENIKGIYPYYGASGIIDYVNDYIFDGKYLLIGEDGANLLARSKPIAFIAEGKFWVNNHAHIIQTLDDIHLEFVKYFFNITSLNQFITGTAQPKLTQAALNRIVLPLPPIKEQQKIVEVINNSFVLLDKIYETMSDTLKGYPSNKQAILKKAFEGRLVPQDPSDEPASVLLERIQKERASKEKKTTRSRSSNHQERLDSYGH